MFNFKLFGIIGGVLAILAFIGWVMRIDHLRADYKGQLEETAAIVAKVGGFKPLKADYPHIHDGVVKIGAQRDQAAHDRDVYLGNWQASKAALLDQTQRVVALGDETRRLRDLSDRQQALVARLTAQRNGWIQRAQAASTRTQRLSDTQEAAQCEEAMDDVRKAGF